MTTIAKFIALFLFLVFISFPLVLSAQLYQGLRYQASIEKEYKVNKKFRINFEQEFQATPEFKKNSKLTRTRDIDFSEIDFIDDDFLPKGYGFEGKDDRDDDGDGSPNGLDDDDDNDGSKDDKDDDDDNDGISDDMEDDDDDTSNDDGDDGDDDGDDDDDDFMAPWEKSKPFAKSNDPVWGRFDQRMGLRAASSAAFTYQLNKSWRVQTGYTLNIRPGRETHRLFTDLVFNKRIFDKKFNFNSRWRLNHDGGLDGRNDPEFIIRSFASWQLQLRLRAENWRPFVNTDLVYRFKKGDNEFQRARLSTGVDFVPFDQHAFRFSMDWQQRFNVSKNAQALTFTVGYAFNLDQN
jgi:hypothetical protein